MKAGITRFPPAYTGFDSSTEGDMDGDGIADNDDNCPGPAKW